MSEQIEEYNEKNESDSRYVSEQSILFSEYADETSSLALWLKDIVEEVKMAIQDGDDGDRDNIMYNEPFAEHFLRLCKLLPLWCGVTCKVFFATSVTSSSANVESYFKDVKHTLKDIIPASADVFLQHHMDGIDDSIITASQKYAKIIKMNITEKSQQLADSEDLGKNVAYDDDPVLGFLNPFNQEEEDECTIGSNVEVEGNSSGAATECIACLDGNHPTGAHTCVKCHKNVHILDGCSFPIGSEEEGHGSKRICASCHSNEQSATQQKIAKEMNTKESWKPKKQRVKKSIYLQKNPAFNLMSDTKKCRIALLKNGSKFLAARRVNGKNVVFANTCAFDAIAQALAGAYAYYPYYRERMGDTQSDQLLTIAIALAKKYAFTI